MTTVEQLTEVFNDNFVAYFRSHVAHVNIMGRNFTSDHQLLGGIYEELQEQIDVIAEILRTLNAFMPDNINDILFNTSIITDPITGDSIELLYAVRDDLLQLKHCYGELAEIASEEELEEIENYAQERMLALGKHIWQLESTLS